MKVLSYLKPSDKAHVLIDEVIQELLSLENVSSEERQEEGS